MKRFTLEKTMPLRLIFVDSDNHLIDARPFKIKYNLITTVAEGEHDISAQLNQNISLAKINFFIDHYLNNNIALDSDDRTSVFPLFSEYENNYLVLPDLTESTLMEAIHCKLNSLCKPGSRVEHIQLFDELTDVNYTFYITEDEEYQLPDITEWLGELSFWNEPWWQRDDVSTYDNTAANAEELEKWRENLESNGSEMVSVAHRVFAEIEEAVESSFREVMEQAGLIPKVERGQLIEVDFVNTNNAPKREKWTPKII